MVTRTPKLNLPLITPGTGKHVLPISGVDLIFQAANYQRQGWVPGFGKRRLNPFEHTTYTTVEKRAVA